MLSMCGPIRWNSATNSQAPQRASWRLVRAPTKRALQIDWSPYIEATTIALAPNARFVHCAIRRPEPIRADSKERQAQHPWRKVLSDHWPTSWAMQGHSQAAHLRIEQWLSDRIPEHDGLASIPNVLQVLSASRARACSVASFGQYFTALAGFSRLRLAAHRALTWHSPHTR